MSQRDVVTTAQKTIDETVVLLLDLKRKRRLSRGQEGAIDRAVIRLQDISRKLSELRSRTIIAELVLKATRLIIRAWHWLSG